jgi:ribosomal protein L31
MRKDIHPKYNQVNVVFPGGESASIMSTYNKGNTIHAELHFLKHPAWSGGRAETNTFANSVAEFNNKYGGLLDGFSGNAGIKSTKASDTKNS